MSMSAVVVNYNGGPDLLGCLRSLEGQAGLHETIVVDNGSQDGSLEAARRAHPDVRFLAREINDGFGGAANFGAAHATGELLLFLNPDVALESSCVPALVALLGRHPGAAGPVLRVEASGSTEYGATVDLLGMPEGLEKPSAPLYVPGCSLATNAQIFERLGGFDTRYFLFVEDTEYCWRVLLAGHEVTVCEEAVAWHRGGGSTPGGYVKGSQLDTTELRVRLRERNGLSMFLACAPGRWLPALVVAHVVKTVGVAMAAVVVFRRPSLGRALVQGLWWNVRQCRVTVTRRRSIARTRSTEQEAFNRLARRSNMLRLLRRYGLPHFVDDRRREGAPG